MMLTKAEAALNMVRGIIERAREQTRVLREIQLPLDHWYAFTDAAERKCTRVCDGGDGLTRYQFDGVTIVPLPARLSHEADFGLIYQDEWEAWEREAGKVGAP